MGNAFTDMRTGTEGGIEFTHNIQKVFMYMLTSYQLNTHLLLNTASVSCICSNVYSDRCRRQLVILSQNRISQWDPLVLLMPSNQANQI